MIFVALGKKIMTSVGLETGMKFDGFQVYPWSAPDPAAIQVGCETLIPDRRHNNSTISETGGLRNRAETETGGLEIKLRPRLGILPETEIGGLEIKLREQRILIHRNYIGNRITYDASQPGGSSQGRGGGFVECNFC